MKPGWATRLLGKEGGKIEVYHGGRVILNTIEIKDLFEGGMTKCDSTFSLDRLKLLRKLASFIGQNFSFEVHH